jgi:branched-chain amino acid transport system substrate-binding protein
MLTSTTRRAFLRTSAAAVAASPAILTRPGWAQTGPVKLGALEPQSGPVKYVGDNDVAAYRFAIERVNAAGGVLGRKLELVVADSEMKPDVSTRRANDLILGDKVDFLTGLGSGVAKVASAVAAQQRKVFFTAGSEAAELTGSDFQPTTFRCTTNTDMHGAQLATYFCRMAPQKPTRFYLLHEDYNFGREAAEGFKKRFERVKGPRQSIVGEAYHPFQKVQDFGPYVTKIVASGADCVITGNWGQDLRLLLQQGADLGWKVKIGNFFLNDPPTLLTVDTPDNREFIRQWRQRYPDAPPAMKFPDLNMGRNAWAVMWVADVIRRAGSLDTERLIKAWEGARFNMVWGEVEMRACDHQMLTPGWVAEVMEPERIPADVRYFGAEIPYIGPATMIPRDEMTVPAAESGNKRCV